MRCAREVWARTLVRDAQRDKAPSKDETDDTQFALLDGCQFRHLWAPAKIDHAMVFMPEGTDVTTRSHDSTEFYDALVNAFAEAVVVRLE